jgi:RimK-like ATP-grasp domain
VILLCGIPSERALVLVADALEELGAPFVVLNQRQFGDCGLWPELIAGQVSGLIRVGRRTLPLAEVSATYLRVMDFRALPELRAAPPRSRLWAHCRALHESLDLWAELTEARVVNRPSAQASNASKPYQAQLIAGAGFRTPETLITDDPEQVLDFRARHGALIYKSMSGVRSVVRELGEEDLRRLPRIRACPTQFQRRVPGHDVRVHCVGQETFGTAVHSAATDYRYGAQDGHDVSLAPASLDADVENRCVGLTAALGLEVAGIDLRMTPEGEAYCFEVNPSPAFSYYEDSTGQPIARAVARHLAAA